MSSQPCSLSTLIEHARACLANGHTEDARDVLATAADLAQLMEDPVPPPERAGVVVARQVAEMVADPAVREAISGLVALLGDALSVARRDVKTELAEPASVFPCWGVVQVMGRREVAGRLLREPGTKLIRVEEPSGRVRLLGQGSIFSATLLSEQTARALEIPDYMQLDAPGPDPVQAPVHRVADLPSADDEDGEVADDDENPF